MSYDINLCDPVSKETIKLPVKHVMTGGTYAASYDSKARSFEPAATSEAWLNITYNYAPYYYEAAENDHRFYREEDGELKNAGIRGIYGKTGAESIDMLKDLIVRIEDRYKKNGEWIFTERNRVKYYDENGCEVDLVSAIGRDLKYKKIEYTEMISEGPNSNYWEATACNAIRPLHQLIAIASLRPDGVWDGD